MIKRPRLGVSKAALAVFTVELPSAGKVEVLGSGLPFEYFLAPVVALGCSSLTLVTEDRV